MVLEDHIRQGKQFIPRVKKIMPISEVKYAGHILPEMVWMAFVLQDLGLVEGVHALKIFIEAAYKLAEWNPWPEFTFISCYRRLTDVQKQTLLGVLRAQGVAVPLQTAVSRFLRVYPKDNPLMFLLRGALRKPFKKDLAAAKAAISKSYDRRSRDAVILQSMTLYTGLLSGKLTYNKGLALPNLNAIITDFEGESGQQAAGHVRAMLSSFHSAYQKDIGLDWAGYFWSRGFELERPLLCLPHYRNLEQMKDPFQRFSAEYENHVNMLLEQTWLSIPKEGTSHEVVAVVGALLSRQAHLSIALSRTPDYWEWNFGPLILRAMADCHITIAWILTKPAANAHKFVDYGLGQTKLMIEHYSEAAEQETDPDAKRELEHGIAEMSKWLNDQHFSFLQDVNVGSWSGIDTRQMAIEAGCLDFYRYVYVPFSNCAHNSWSHLGRLCCIPSPNPLHKFIRVPCHPDCHPEPQMFMNAVKYYNKSLNSVWSHYHITVEAESVWDWGNRRMSQLVDELNGSARQEHE